MRLNESFRPQALWVIEAKNVAWANVLKKNRTMPKLGNNQSGSAEFCDCINETDSLLEILELANPSFNSTYGK